MKVLCLPEPGNLVIKDLPMPELKEGQAIVKMENVRYLRFGCDCLQGSEPHHALSH